MVPNADFTTWHKVKPENIQDGTLCAIEYSTNRNSAQSFQEKCNKCVLASLAQFAAYKYLRDIESVKTEKLKFELDKVLELILDEPKMPNYITTARSNSILDQLYCRMAQGIYNSG